jgi:hypothetical protein
MMMNKIMQLIRKFLNFDGFFQKFISFFRLVRTTTRPSDNDNRKRAAKA